MNKIIIHVDDDIPETRAVECVHNVMRLGMISVAPGNNGRMQYCYHTTIGNSPSIEVSASRLLSGTHVFRVWSRE